MKNRIFAFIIWLTLLCQPVYALNNDTGSLDTLIQTGWNNGQSYLMYAMYAASVLGLLSIAFMLFHNVQDAMLKHVVKGFAIIGLVSLAFTAPTWFGLNINFIG